MNKYDLPRSKFLIIISVLITFSLLYLFSYIRGLELLTINSNNYMSSSSKKFSVTVNNDSCIDDVIEAVRNMNVVSIRNNEGLTMFFFNKNGVYGPKIKWIKDLKGEEKYNILLGKEKYKAYLDSGKKNYELILKGSSVFCNVAGILESGEYDFKDFSEYVILDLDDASSDDLNGIYRVEGDVSAFTSKLNLEGIDIDERDMNLITLSGGRFLSVQFIFMGIVVFLFLFTMVLISRLWFGLYMKEAAIRILHGAGRYFILSRVCINFISAQVIGSLIGVLLFYVYFEIIDNGLGLGFLLIPMLLYISTISGISLLVLIFNYQVFLKNSLRNILES